MESREFLRQHCLTVLLGLPNAPFRSCLSLLLKNGARPYLFAHARPFLLSLFPVAFFHKSTGGRYDDILLKELKDFAEEHPDKCLTLIPANEKMRIFVVKNRVPLEAFYIIPYLTEGEHHDTL